MPIAVQQPSSHLVCMLSAHQIPNLLSVHHLKPDKLFLLVTPEMSGRVEGFLRALELGGAHYEQGTNAHVVDITPGDKGRGALAAVRGKLLELRNANPDAAWIYNLTGGTKAMEFAAYDTARFLGIETCYVAEGEPDRMHFLASERAPEPFRHALRVDEFLASYGIQTAVDADSEACAREMLGLAVAFALVDHPVALNASSDGDLTRMRKRLREGRMQCAPGEIVLPGGLHAAVETERQRRAGQPHHASLMPFRLEEGSIAGRIDEFTGEFLTGGWLEVLVYGLLERHRLELGLSDVRLGIRLGDPGFEIDTAFVEGQRLVSIECKTGMSHDPGFEAMHKLEAIKAHYRAGIVGGIFVTTAREVYATGTQTVKDHLLKRARAYQCSIVCPADIRLLAQAAQAGPQQTAAELRRLFLGGRKGAAP